MASPYSGGRSRRRRRRKKRSSPLPLLITLVLGLALCAGALYYVGIFPGQMKEAAYPLKYQDLIHRYAGEYGLESARVAAVIYCESSFDPQAVSSVGARGLMQIMPSTGKWIAKKLGEEGYNKDMLFDPETNVRYGCWYLNYLNGRFDGDLTKVTAAYHAGGGSVDKWLKDPECSSDGKTLQHIPSSVTGNYVNKVIRMVDQYKEIMNP